MGARSSGARGVGARGVGARCVGARCMRARCVGARCVGARCIGARCTRARGMGVPCMRARNMGARYIGARGLGAQGLPTRRLKPRVAERGTAVLAPPAGRHCAGAGSSPPPQRCSASSGRRGRGSGRRRLRGARGARDGDVREQARPGWTRRRFTGHEAGAALPAQARPGPTAVMQQGLRLLEGHHPPAPGLPQCPDQFCTPWAPTLQLCCCSPAGGPR
eukprot:XP_013965625.1 uncharacterized protein LOC106558162 [Canis lupus familiaris]